MENKKISVIIPVYNVEKYIRQCLESVINQTYKSLEIIVVNDGTKDDSMKIVEEYLFDKRIKVINKENGGISSARNRGMKEVTGDYIYFLDSDDWLELNSIEIFVKNLEENLEIIGANFYLFDEINKEKRVNNLRVRYDEIEEGKYFLMDELESVVWNKLYKTSFLKENNIMFLENIIHEDEEFTFKCYMIAKKIKYFQNITYNYRVNRDGSIMNEIVKNNEKRLDSIISIEKIIEQIKKEQNKFNDYFIQIRLVIREYILKERVLREKKLFFSKSEIIEFEKIVEKINFNILGEKEKIILRKELQNLIIKRQFRKINIYKLFFWKNKILNMKILRKIISRRLKNLNI